MVPIGSVELKVEVSLSPSIRSVTSPVNSMSSPVGGIPDIGGCLVVVVVGGGATMIKPYSEN